MLSYTWNTSTGTLVLERVLFTQSTWQFLFNGRYIDAFESPNEGARYIAGIAPRLGIDPPPADLSRWEARFTQYHDGGVRETVVYRG